MEGKQVLFDSIFKLFGLKIIKIYIKILGHKVPLEMKCKYILFICNEERLYKLMRGQKKI